MFDLSKFTDKSNKIIVGAVRINKTFVYHKQDYEVAAWWENQEAQLGVHPVYLYREHLAPNALGLVAHINAKVVNDYFPGLWGGVPISREPYQPKSVGQDRTIYHKLDIVKAIEATGNSPGEEKDIFIHPSWWPVFIEEAEAELRKDFATFPKFYNEWNELKRETFEERNIGYSIWTFENEYQSKVGMIAHFGGVFEKWARRAEKIAWQIDYHRPGSRHDTEHNRHCFKNNTEWAKAISMQANE
jgi:hypothetical protein